MADTFKDFVPAGGDTGGYGSGQFKDFVPAGEELPEGMTGEPLTLASEKSLKDMKLAELVEYANGIGIEIEAKPGMKKQTVIDMITEKQAGNPAEEETAEEGDEEAETEESEGDTDEQPEVPGLDEQV